MENEENEKKGKKDMKKTEKIGKMKINEKYGEKEKKL